MSAEELLALLQKKDHNVRRVVFDRYYGRLAGIALRYCKNQAQATEIFNQAFNVALGRLLGHRQIKSIDPEEFLVKEFILECVAAIKNIRNEYYVSSTVHATDVSPKNFNLFENNDWIDYNQVDTDVLVQSIQQLVPSQRLVFNLHVIDGIDQKETATLLESSEQTVKSNLEKARYNLQKNIEKNLKSIKA